jgi:hypothetical protein
LEDPVKIRLAAFISLLATAARFAQAQGAINDGNATFVVSAGHFDTTPAANLTGVSAILAQDHVLEEGWWYRVQGDAAEKFFPVPTSQSYVGNVATLDWTNVDGRGFSAHKVLTVTNTAASGRVRGELTLTNNNPTDLLIAVFHALDMDLAGTAGGDVGVLGTANELIRIADGVQTGEYQGESANSFMVRPFDAGGATDVPGLLSDADLDDFDNTGLPFAAGDITMGFQWTTVTIPPGGQRTYAIIIAVNDTVPVELLGFTVE